MTSVTSPENGTTIFEYDNNGNVTRQTDMRNVQINYTYDALNRPIFIDYSDATPDVTCVYDATSVANSKGKLTSVSSSASTYNYTGYDSLGRLRGSSQVTDGITYTMPDYRYNLAGELLSQQYPSGKVIATEYDSAGRMAGVKNSSTSAYYVGAAPTDPGNSIQYAANGEAAALKLGNGLWEHTSLNSRFQPVQIGLGTTPTNSSILQLDYDYGTSTNNNNIQSQTITAPGLAVKQIYTYDQVNRLTLAQETKVSDGSQTWKQGYTYLDQNQQNGQLGNRRVDPNNTTPEVMPLYNPQINPSTNRISDPGYSYDDSGNLLCDPAHPCGQTPFIPYYAYDAENRLVNAGGSPDAGGTNYIYDGNGRRVKKIVGAVTTVFVYNAGGQLIAEYSNGQQPTQSSAISYLTYDHLGSTRVVTGQNQEVKSRMDYLPFGGDLSVARASNTSSNIRQKYTSYEQDLETGLDFAQARYYSNTTGRFNSVDPSMASAVLTEPQSWNRYAYCLNNPVNVIDPSGLVWLTADYMNFTYVSDAEYDPSDSKWQGYHEVPPGSVVYFGLAWGTYANGQYDYLRGGYVTLNADGSPGPANDPNIEDDELPTNAEPENFNLTPLTGLVGTVPGGSGLVAPATATGAEATALTAGAEVAGGGTALAAGPLILTGILTVGVIDLSGHPRPGSYDNPIVHRHDDPISCVGGTYYTKPLPIPMPPVKTPCPACPQPPPPQIHRVPPSRPHYPCPGDHWHYFVYNQNPITCVCYLRRMFGGCCGQPGAPC